MSEYKFESPKTKDLHTNVFSYFYPSQRLNFKYPFLVDLASRQMPSPNVKSIYDQWFRLCAVRQTVSQAFIFRQKSYI